LATVVRPRSEKNRAHTGLQLAYHVMFVAIDVVEFDTESKPFVGVVAEVAVVHADPNVG